MCGHVGIAGNLGAADEKTFKRLLLMDYFRGPDSTGLASLKMSGSVEISKMASHPLDLFDSKSFGAALNGYTSYGFLGHNRLATKGKVNGLNAHPFRCGHIIGAHNGTLDSRSWKMLEDLVGEETEVDSKAIFLAIEKFGIEETMKHMHGAWALVWYDLSESDRPTLNFLRNKERPLWYARSDDGDRLFWASEYEMIQASLGMSEQIEKVWTDKQGYSYFPFETDTLYTYDVKSLTHSPTYKPTTKELKGIDLPVVTYGSNYGGQGAGNFTTTGTGTGTTTRTKTTPPKSITLGGSAADPFASVLVKERFDELATGGCGFCKSDVEYTQLGLYVDLVTEQVLCPACNPNYKNTKVVVNPDDYDLVAHLLSKE